MTTTAFTCPPRRHELHKMELVARPWGLVRWPFMGGRLVRPATLEPAVLFDEPGNCAPGHVYGRLLCHAHPRLVPVALVVGRWPAQPRWPQVIRCQQLIDTGGDPTTAIMEAHHAAPV